MVDQTSLFSDNECQHIKLDQGGLRYFPNWLSTQQSSELQDYLRAKVQWEQSAIILYGKKIKIPRLNAWYGDEDCPYRYSGYSFTPKPWLPPLNDLRQKLYEEINFRFNSVLVNCYRNGQDSVAWHSDDEPELGKNPIIASVTLGAARIFQLRHKYDKSLSHYKLLLENGSLLIMEGALQHYWQHQLPKTQKQVDERLNLTYRYVIPSPPN